MIRRSNVTSRLLNSSGAKIVNTRQQEYLFKHSVNQEEVKIVKINFFKKLLILIKNKLSLCKTKIYGIRFIKCL